MKTSAAHALPLPWRPTSAILLPKKRTFLGLFVFISFLSFLFVLDTTLTSPYAITLLGRLNVTLRGNSSRTVLAFEDKVKAERHGKLYRTDMTSFEVAEKRTHNSPERKEHETHDNGVDENQVEDERRLPQSGAGKMENEKHIHEDRIKHQNQGGKGKVENEIRSDKGKTEHEKHSDEDKTEHGKHSDEDKTEHGKHSDEDKTEHEKHSDEDKTEHGKHSDEDQTEHEKHSDEDKAEHEKHSDEDKAEHKKHSDEDKTEHEKHSDKDKAEHEKHSDKDKANAARQNKFRKALEWNGAALKRGHPQWQKLDGNFTAFVYSAHFDDVDDPPVVRVIGIAIAVEFLPFTNVTCRYYDRRVGAPRVLDVSGVLYHFRDRNGRNYIGAYIDCSLPRDMASFPFAVSVYKKNETWLETNYMIIHYSHSDKWLKDHTHTTHHFASDTSDTKPMPLNKTEQKEEIYKNFKKKREADVPRWNITRCIPAFQLKYNKYTLLAEMVAASRALGVQHFVFYVESAGPDVLRMLKVLEKEGIAEVHPWNMHLYLKDLFYVAQFSAIQDCLYRHQWSSRFLLFADVDELFVPRKHNALMPLLQSSFDKRPECGAFFFLHTNYNLFLATQRPPRKGDPDGYAPQHNLTMLTHVVRNTNILPVGQRSKSVVDPHKVFTGSVHVIKKLRKGFRACTIDTELGLLHHYRNYPAPAQKLQKVDTILWQFTSNIIQDVRSYMQKYNDTVGLPYP